MLGHARTLVRRDGPSALTMRALAQEAGCSVGLAYKVFADREEIVIELITLELDDLVEQFDEWLAETAQHSVSANLDRYATILLDSPTAGLVHAELMDARIVDVRLAAATRDSAFLASLHTTVPDYLRLEQRRGRVRADVDADAFGFLITSAIHNLIAAGSAYPRPTRAELTAILDRVAQTIT
nr:TetR/AcrR family transcriptional regulator [Microbacterium immunditiarum]